MQKYTCRFSWHTLNFSPLRLVSCFWLSGHLFLAMQFISEFVWVNLTWNGPTCQAHPCFSCISNWKERIPRARNRNTGRANQSASQDCRLATNQLLKSDDLRHQLKIIITIIIHRLHFKTRPCLTAIFTVLTPCYINHTNTLLYRQHLAIFTVLTPCYFHRINTLLFDGINT